MKKNQKFIESLRQKISIWEFDKIYSMGINITSEDHIGIIGEPDFCYQFVKEDTQKRFQLDFNKDKVLIKINNIYKISEEKLKQFIQIADKYFNIHPQIKHYFDIPLKKSEVYL